MSSVQDLVESFFIMFIMILVASIMLIAIAVPWDIISPIFKAAGMENVPQQWNTFDDRDFLIDLLYGIIYALYIIGPLQFVLACVKSQDYDNYDSGGRVF